MQFEMIPVIWLLTLSGIFMAGSLVSSASIPSTVFRDTSSLDFAQTS
jgi:hypothetical protein